MTTTTGPTTQPPTKSGEVWTVESLTADPDVRDVCEAHDLGPALSQALQLIVRVFSPIQDVRAEVDVDPDTDERRVVMDVTVDVGVDDLLRQYEAWTRAWVSAAPAAAREWVRLAIHPIRDA